VRISHIELERCLSDPCAWVASKISPTFPPRQGYDACLKEGIYRFHKTDDVALGRARVEQAASRRKLTNRLRIDDALTRFEAYVHWCLDSGTVVADVRVGIELDLGSEVILGGQVTRVDITADGYQGVLLGKSSNDWPHELRLPLLQRALASEYDRAESAFAVARQELDGTSLVTVQFSTAEIDVAEQRARNLASTIRAEFAAQQ
jgi:hypothetical protein